MRNFERAMTFVLTWEGEYVNDPKDPGGETKYGISQRRFPDLNIKDLTLEHAKQLYKAYYWKEGNCCDLAHPLDIIHFDATVNIGVRRAGRLLQAMLNKRFGFELTVDGVVGDKTAEAANLEISLFGRKEFCLDYMMERINYYVSLNRAKFLRGWIKRVLDLRQFV